MKVGHLRGLQLLEVLAGMQQPASLAAVVARTGLSQTQTFRALQALECEGYVEHLGRRGYRIGVRAVALATMIGRRPALMEAAHPVISTLVATTSHSVVLHLRSGTDRVLVLGIPRPGESGATSAPPGERSPLNVGCSGRVILAHLPPEVVAEVRPSVPEETLQLIRDRGYDTSSGENHPGVNGVAGPLLDDEGVAMGSITIVGTADRLAATSWGQMVPPLLAACRRLSPRLAAVLGPSPGATVDALDL